MVHIRIAHNLLKTRIVNHFKVFTFGVYKAFPWVEFRGRELLLYFSDVLWMNIVKQTLANQLWLGSKTVK